MTPEAFIKKWSETTTKEKAAAQEHFIDLCRLLDEKTPHEADPTGEWYAFERGVEKTGAGRGWADVWKRGHFGWEYKSKSGGRVSTMAAALRQLQLYALALESPPLLIVSDIDTIEIHTAFQNAVQEVHVIGLKELADPEKLNLLRWAFADPERLRPKRTRNQITAKAAGQFADLASQLREVGHEPQKVAHFLNKLLFCMFAEDAGLLKSNLFTELVEKGVNHPEHFDTFIKQLFQAMQSGGPFGTEIVDWFNGGLFDDDETISLTLAQIRTIRDLARLDWSQIEPAIFGTLFERGLDPSKRSQLGAHYTDPASIMRLVNPSIGQPLLEEWQAVRAVIAEQMVHMEKVKTKEATKKRLKTAQEAFQGYLERLRNFRVLDPACGSGNFLYLALQALKGIEHRANIEAEALGLHRQHLNVGPDAVLGIEINSYAAELARVTVWIGEIQWMLDHGYSLSKNPILKPLDNIEQRDAIMNEDGTEPEWPAADVIVGNPPFLGGSRMLSVLGDSYTGKLRSLYANRVPGGADLVTYWFEKAINQIVNGKAERAGFVATQSIRKGSNRSVLKKIVEQGKLFNAWSDEPWINDGADVRVSLVCFSSNDAALRMELDGLNVRGIFSDLSADTGSSVDLTTARLLAGNRSRSFEGIQKNGSFDIQGDLARCWLHSPNPDGRSNSKVLRPYLKARDITSRSYDKWMIDFTGFSETEAAKFEAPFEYVLKNVKPERDAKREKYLVDKYWLLKRPAPDMRNAIAPLSRYIVTPRVAKHRFFVWLDKRFLPDTRLNVIAREDDECFGVLSSSIHIIWALAMSSRHGVGNDPTYNAQSCFGTFPFPEGLTLDLHPSRYTNEHAIGIQEAARELATLRDGWLNPPEWVDRVQEVVVGYPDRVVPKKGHEADLKKRTLTNLYNEWPTWLENAHRELDEAVAAAYGWSADLSDDQILADLLELNLSREPA